MTKEMASLLDMSKSYHVALQHFNGKYTILTNHDTKEEAEIEKLDMIEHDCGLTDGEDVIGFVVLKNKE